MSGILRSDDPWRIRPNPDERREFTEDDAPHPQSRANLRNDGIDDAYRVADENMRDGQWRSNPRSQQGYDWRSQGYGSRASGYGSPRFGPAYNSPFGSGYGGRSFDGLLEQMIRTYMDMMGMVGTMLNGLTRPAYPPYPRPFEGRRDADTRYGPDPGARGPSAAVRIEVISSQPNQVALDLKALAPGLPLSIPPLRALNNGSLELNDVQLQAESDRYVLRIRIPDGHPAGLYSGLIVETRRGEPCGTIAVQVGRPAQDRTRARPAKKA
jgi:hypothetical protein